MATQPNRPTPLLLGNRSPRITTAPPVTPQAFEEQVPQRGWPEIDLVTDTSVLFAVTSSRDFLAAFKKHYAGRIVITDFVAWEVEQKTSYGANLGSEGQARSAAWTTKTTLLNTGICVIDGDYDSQLYDEIRNQLQNMPNEFGERSHSASHIGEASSIALCRRKIEEGEQVLFLTNDRGASKVARERNVTSLHFVHILRELVCSGDLTHELAYEIWPRSQRISGIPKDQWPADADHFICHAVGDGCEPCDAF